MGREWQTGDVAMISALNRREPYRAYFDGETWREYGSAMFCVDTPHTHRPLVVIDPEDREQVERLTYLFLDRYWSADHQTHTDATQAALHSLIAPPKPDEPTGLGAVVEDAEGRRWVRTEDEGEDRWIDSRVSGDWSAWQDIAAVRVLSEGVIA